MRNELNSPASRLIGGLPTQPGTPQARPFADEAAVNEAIDELIETNKNNQQLLPYLQAWREVGFLLTEDNMHMFTDEEVEDFSAAVARYEQHAAS